MTLKFFFVLIRHHIHFHFKFTFNVMWFWFEFLYLTMEFSKRFSKQAIKMLLLEPIELFATVNNWNNFSSFSKKHFCPWTRTKGKFQQKNFHEIIFSTLINTSRLSFDVIQTILLWLVEKLLFPNLFEFKWIKLIFPQNNIEGKFNEPTVL